VKLCFSTSIVLANQELKIIFIVAINVSVLVFWFRP
jgi:hypothetical protein